MPSVLYPVFLVGAAAVAIPVLLHLLKNEQAPELRFSAVRLLRGVKVEHAQRRRIRDWLLLALRAAALLLLAGAFSRPYFAGGQGASGGATVILLDRSASMGLSGAWQQARDAVLRTADQAPSGDALALVAFDDRAEIVVPPTVDRSAIRSALDSLRPGVAGTRYQAALGRAVSIMDEADAGTGRVVLVSDLQGSAPDARMTIPEGIRLELAPVASPSHNIAILDAHQATGGVVAAVRNDGPGLVRADVRLEVGGRLISETPIDLPPAQIVEATLGASMTAGEARVSLAEPDPSGLTADDARHLALGAGEPTRVLIVSAPGHGFYVDAALRATDDGRGFDIATTPVQGTTAALARRPPPEVVFLVGPRGLDRGGREALARFAGAGGGVFIAASDALNEPGFAALVDGMSVSAPHGDDPVLALGALEGRHPLFRRLGVIGDALAAARFTRAWRVRAPGWQVLARFDDGSGALLERQVGSGRLLFFASDVNRDWNDLPLQTAFVPFVQEVVQYLAPEKSRRDYTPGTLPIGTKVSLGFVRLPSGQRAAVNADPRESEPGRMNAAEFASMVRQHGDRRVDPTASLRRAQAAEQGQGLWRYGLMLMFGTLVVEGLVGSRGTLRRSAGESGRGA